MGGFAEFLSRDSKEQRQDKLHGFLQPAYDFLAEDVGKFVPPNLRPHIAAIPEFVNPIPYVHEAMQESGDALSGTDYYGNQLTPNERVSRGFSSLVKTATIAAPAAVGAKVALAYNPTAKASNEISEAVVDTFSGGMQSTKSEGIQDPSRRRFMGQVGGAVVGGTFASKVGVEILPDLKAVKATKTAAKGFSSKLGELMSIHKRASDMYEVKDLQLDNFYNYNGDFSQKGDGIIPVPKRAEEKEVVDAFEAAALADRNSHSDAVRELDRMITEMDIPELQAYFDSLNRNQMSNIYWLLDDAEFHEYLDDFDVAALGRQVAMFDEGKTVRRTSYNRERMNEDGTTTYWNEPETIADPKYVPQKK